MHTAYIGLGSNLADPRSQVEKALDELAHIEGCKLLARSSLYRSAPVGPGEQQDYINAAASLATTMGPHALLAALQAIEQAFGRRRTVRWAPRVLDLDILLYDRQVIQTGDLQVPHPEMARRNFVLYPLLEIDAGLKLPDGRCLRTLLDACPDNRLQRITS